MYQQGYPGYPSQQEYPPAPGGYPPPSGYPPAGYPQPGYPGGGAQQCYVIVSRLHGLVLDIERGVANPGTRVMPWSRHGKDNQLWYDDPATGTIRTKMNGFCLDIEGDQSLRVMPFQPGDPNQQWERDHEGYIRNRVHRNKVLDIFNQLREPGAKIGMWDSNGGSNQLWNFEFVGGAGFQPGFPPGQGSAYPGWQQPYPGSEQYPGSHHGHHGGGYPEGMFQRRYFFIVSEFSGKVLDIKGGRGNNGDDVILYRKHQGKNQQWYTDQQGFIRSALNDMAINAAPSNKIEVELFNGGPNQQWVSEGNRIVNRANGQVLDVYNSQTEDGTKILSWPWNNTPNQHWRLEYV